MRNRRVTRCLLILLVSLLQLWDYDFESSEWTYLDWLLWSVCEAVSLILPTCALGFSMVEGLKGRAGLEGLFACGGDLRYGG